MSNDTESQEKRPERKRILLLGSSQCGKSSFGSFLVLREELQPENTKELFFVDFAGSNLQSVTLQTSERDFDYEYKYYQDGDYEEMKKCKMCKVSVVDTPGIGDTRIDRRNEENILDFINFYNANLMNEEITIPVFLIKYGGEKIGDEYKKQLKFYHTLLKDIFVKNLVLVITDVRVYDEMWRREKRCTLSAEEMEIVIKKSILEQLDGVFDFEFDVKTINSHALESERKDFEHALSVREEILQKACDPKTVGVTITDKIPLIKSIEMREFDDRKIEQVITGRIKFLEEGISESEAQDINLAEEIRTLLQEKERIKKSLFSVGEELKRIGSPKPDQRVMTVPLVKDWKILDFRVWVEAEFTFFSEFPVLLVKSSRSNLNTVKYEVERVSERYKVTGTVTGGIAFGGINDKLTVWTSLRAMSEKKVKKLLETQEEKKGENEKNERTLGERIDRQKIIRAKLIKLKQDWEIVSNEIEKLRENECTIEEYRDFYKLEGEKKLEYFEGNKESDEGFYEAIGKIILLEKMERVKEVED